MHLNIMSVFAPSKNLLSCADGKARFKIFKLFTPTWDDLIYEVTDYCNEAYHTVPDTGKSYRRICVDCELTRRKEWVKTNGYADDATIEEFWHKPPSGFDPDIKAEVNDKQCGNQLTSTNGVASVVGGSRGSDTAESKDTCAP